MVLGGFSGVLPTSDYYCFLFVDERHGRGETMCPLFKQVTTYWAPLIVMLGSWRNATVRCSANTGGTTLYFEA